jgi:dolichol-phosphate mannosyltransferase
MPGDRSARFEVTVLTACFNEAATLEELHGRVMKALDDAGVDGHLLVVDDGSRDDTHAVLTALAERDPRLGFVRLSRNFGQQAAISAGLDCATGDAVIVIDGDLQDPPELIPKMIQRFREGFDVVYGVRENRKEAIWKRGAYRTFYALQSLLADIDIPPAAGDFGLMSRRVVDAIRASGERHRFIRGLRRWAGFEQTSLAYDRPARPEGRPRYTLRKLLRLGLDGLMSFSRIPLRAATLIGLISAGAAGSYLVYGIAARLLVEQTPPGWASLVAAVIGMAGIQLIVLGVIGEYIGQIYDEVKERPVYVIEETRNVPDASMSNTVGVRVTSERAPS